MATTVISGIMQSGDYAGSTLDLAFDKPELYGKIIKQHSAQYRDTLGLDFRKMGLELPMEADYGTLWLEGWVHENFIVAAGGVGASAPGGTQIIPLDATSITNGNFYPKVSHIIIYPTTLNEQGVIESVDFGAGTVTVRAAAGVTLPLLAGGETIAIVSTAFGTGTTQPEASKKTYEQIHFQTQIIKDDIGIDGTQLTNKAWVDVSEWGGAYKYYNVALADLDARMDRFEEGAMLSGTGLTYTPTAGTILGTTLRQTKGILTWGKERGSNVQVVPTAIDKTDLRAIRTYFRSEGDMSREIFGWTGSIFGEELSDEIFTDVSAAGGTDITTAMSLIMGRNGVDEESIGARAVTMNYQQLNDHGGSYVWRSVDAYNDPKGLGGTGYTFNQKSMWLPMCNLKDAKSKSVYPNVALRYKASEGYNRRRETVSLVGATNGLHTTRTDANLTGMKGEIAMQVMNPNLIYLTRPEA